MIFGRIFQAMVVRQSSTLPGSGQYCTECLTLGTRKLEVRVIVVLVVVPNNVNRLETLLSSKY